MAGSDRVGVVSISIDGAWDIDDLLALAEALTETYGLFYPIVATDDEVARRLHDQLRKRFWSGEIETRLFGRVLYRSIPRDEAIRIKSFNYSSPGVLEIVAVLTVLMMIAKVATCWAKAAENLISAWDKVDKFFAKRKRLRRPPKRMEVDEDLALSVDEARALVLEIGPNLGLDALSCERLIEILGNPVAALKYLVAIANEARKMATLQQNGLLKLPDASDAQIVIPKRDQRGRSSGGGLTVLKSRNPKAKVRVKR